MAQSLVDFSQFKQPTSKEREAQATATKAEAAAAVAPELTRAQLRAAELQAEETEAKLRDREEKKAAAEQGKAAIEAKARADKEMLLGLLANIQQARDVASRIGATGVTAQVTGGLFGSPAKELQGALSPIKSKVVLDALQRARVGSAVGATGFGALQIRELALLENALGSLAEDQPPEAILRTLDNIDRLSRRQLAFGAGYDPDQPEGAVMFGLPAPEGTEDLPLPSVGEVEAGRWEKNPELAGIDAAITSMIKAGRSADQIRQYLNEYQPGLGDKATNIQANIDYWRQTGEDPGVTIERYFVPEEPGLISEFTDTPVGAGTQAALNQLSMGVSGLIPGETGQQIRAVQRGLEAKYPTSTGIGNVLGGIASGVTGMAAAGRLGMKLPGLLEGTVQEGLRGAFMAEPGERLGGAAEGSLTALGGNVLMKPVSSLAGNILRGATPDAATLSQKYGITLSPGQLAGVDEGTLAGLPIVGGQVQARRNESLIDFNRAAFRDALAPIGADVASVGQQGIADAQKAVSDAYTQALGGVTLNIDAPLLQTIRGKPYAELAALPGIGSELTRSVDDVFAKYADPQNGIITGENLQNALQEIQQLKNAYRQDPRWANRIAPALDEISDGYVGALERQAPDNFNMFTDANTAYRNLSVLEGAVLKAPDGDIFGPGNLRTATNQATAKFGGRKAAARGDKPFNELIQAATDVIPKKADEVSLTGRLFPVGAGAGAGLGGMTLLASPSDDTTGQDEGPSHLPPSLLAAALGAGLTSLPYGRGGTRLTNVLLGGQRSRNQQLLGDLIYNYMTPGARGAFVGTTSEPGVPMPQEPVSPELVISPEMRAAVLGSAPPPAEGEAVDLGGFEPQYEEAAPPEALGPKAGDLIVVDNRDAVYDPVAKAYVFADTGEIARKVMKRGGAVKGYQNGGRVGEPAFQRRQREQQERQAAAARRVQQQMEADRQRRLAANQRNIERARAAGRGQTVSEGRGYNTNAARARTALQGLTLASGDEAEAALREGVNALTEMRLPTLAGYYDIKDDINRGLERYAADNPGEALLFEGGGAALTGLIPGAQGATAARLAALASRYPTRSALARLGAESAAYGVGAADRPSDIPRSVAEEGVLASLMYGGTRAGGAGIRKGTEFVTRASNRGAVPQDAPPTIENIIAYPEFTPEGAPSSMLYGRPMRSAEEATYASRNMSLAEIEDALASGVFRMPPSGETRHGVGKKWWSPADEEGVFGRTWAKGSDTVRVPMRAFTPNAPLSVRAAQRWDEEAGAWVPMTPSATRKARGGLAVKKVGKR